MFNAQNRFSCLEGGGRLRESSVHKRPMANLESRRPENVRVGESSAVDLKEHAVTAASFSGDSFGSRLNGG
jgi:hypothetical protein